MKSRWQILSATTLRKIQNIRTVSYTHLTARHPSDVSGGADLRRVRLRRWIPPIVYRRTKSFGKRCLYRPVSYTHLDVYKRQVPISCHLPFPQGRPESGLPFENSLLHQQTPGYILPAFYLSDVYKRQAEGRKVEKQKNFSLKYWQMEEWLKRKLQKKPKPEE